MNCVVNTSIAPRITDILRGHTILYKRRRKLFSTGGALCIIRTQFLWRKSDFRGVKPNARAAPA